MKKKWTITVEINELVVDIQEDCEGLTSLEKHGVLSILTQSLYQRSKPAIKEEVCPR